jgi:mannose/fructose/N-acetylgalactosamine-specific phosphotransferase system component IID
LCIWSFQPEYEITNSCQWLIQEFLYHTSRLTVMNNSWAALSHQWQVMNKSWAALSYQWQVMNNSWAYNMIHDITITLKNYCNNKWDWMRWMASHIQFFTSSMKMSTQTMFNKNIIAMLKKQLFIDDGWQPVYNMTFF